MSDGIHIIKTCVGVWLDTFLCHNHASEYSSSQVRLLFPFKTCSRITSRYPFVKKILFLIFFWFTFLFASNNNKNRLYMNTSSARSIGGKTLSRDFKKHFKILIFFRTGGTLCMRQFPIIIKLH